jgi:hypothetical protein
MKYIKLSLIILGMLVLLGLSTAEFKEQILDVGLTEDVTTTTTTTL